MSCDPCSSDQNPETKLDAALLPKPALISDFVPMCFSGSESSPAPVVLSFLQSVVVPIPVLVFHEPDASEVLLVLYV